MRRATLAVIPVLVVVLASPTASGSGPVPPPGQPTSPAVAVVGSAGAADPRITAVSPRRGPTSGGTRVVVSGKNFSHLKRVTIGGQRATVLEKSRTRVVVRAPEAPSCARQTVPITVRTTAGTSKPRRPARFTYDGLSVTPALTAGTAFSVALRSDGQVFAWGSGWSGTLGQGPQETGLSEPGDVTDHLTPVRVKRLGCITQIAAGNAHAAALSAGGRVYSWGDARVGQIGDGYLGTRFLASRAHLSKKVVQISAGLDKTVAVTASGEVYGWGWADAEEFGDLTSPINKTPTAIRGYSDVVQAAAGNVSVVAIRKDGTVWSTGPARLAGIDSADSTRLTEPRQAVGISDVVDVRAGAAVNAVTRDGDLWGWGANGSSYAGGPGVGYGGQDVLVPTRTDLGAVASTDGSTATAALALRRDGTVWGWGYCPFCDPAGVDDSDGIRFSPTQSGLDDISAVASSGRRFLALAGDGSVWQWGFLHYDDEDNAPVYTVTPVKVSGLDLTP